MLWVSLALSLRRLPQVQVNFLLSSLCPNAENLPQNVGPFGSLVPNLQLMFLWFLNSRFNPALICGTCGVGEGKTTGCFCRVSVAIAVSSVFNIWKK